MQYNGIYTSFFWKKQGLLLSARKSDKKKTEILIIVMTANAFEEDRIAAMKAGMTGYLVKPLDIEMVLDEIRKYV